MVSSTTQKLSYSDKLHDPRWQRKRLEIFQRDNWTCQKCGATANTLTVHHRRYHPKQEPWDTPNSDLVTLCEWCHETEGAEGWEDSIHTMISALKKTMWSEEAHELACAIGCLEPHPIDTGEMRRLCCLIDWLLGNPEDRRWVQDLSVNRLKERGDEHMAWLLEQGGFNARPSPPCRPQDFDDWLDAHPNAFFGQNSVVPSKEKP